MSRIETDAETIALSAMAKEVFNKHIVGTFKSRKEYGSSWRSRRLPYFTERMASKMERIRNLEDNALNGIPPMNEGIAAEIKDNVCYGLMALIKLGEIGPCPRDANDTEAVVSWARKYFGIQGGVK